jgi:hypothetical protein
MALTTLKEELSNWTDADFAAYALAECLGLMAPDVEFSTRAKHVFWAANPIGTVLSAMLNSLVDVGVLEKRDEPSYQYRWNSKFRGSWE